MKDFVFVALAVLAVQISAAPSRPQREDPIMSLLTDLGINPNDVVVSEIPFTSGEKVKQDNKPRVVNKSVQTPATFLQPPKRESAPKRSEPANQELSAKDAAFFDQIFGGLSSGFGPSAPVINVREIPAPKAKPAPPKREEQKITSGGMSDGDTSFLAQLLGFGSPAPSSNPFVEVREIPAQPKPQPPKREVAPRKSNEMIDQEASILGQFLGFLPSGQGWFGSNDPIQVRKIPVQRDQRPAARPKPPHKSDEYEIILTPVDIVPRTASPNMEDVSMVQQFLAMLNTLNSLPSLFGFSGPVANPPKPKLQVVTETTKETVTLRY